MMRLDKYLSLVTKYSRSELKKIIRSGRISVNGSNVNTPEFKVNEETDEIVLDGETLGYKKNVYYMLNKPAGLLTATMDKKKETVLDLFPPELKKRLFPVGRLDLDTEGLLILTDDGAFGHRMESPKHNVKKVYLAEATGELVGNYREMIEGGIEFQDFTAKPAEIEILKAEGNEYTVKLTISEGKFHQVKRMLHAVGIDVTYLKRVRIGTLDLDESLAPGEFRELTASDLEKLDQ